MRDLLGYRRMLGLITPAENTVAIADGCRIALTGVTVHQSDFRCDRPSDPDAHAGAVRDALGRMRSKGPVAAALCLDEDMEDGAQVDAILSDAARADRSTVIVRPFDALHAALQAVGASRPVAVVSPFPIERHRRMVARLQASGVPVVADATAEFDDDRAAAQTTYVAMRALYDAVTADGRADVAVQLGHNFPMARQVDNLEEDHGRPVLAINTVCIWHLLRLSGINDPVPGHGALLMDH